MNGRLNIYFLWIQILRAKHLPGKLDERTNYKMPRLRTLSILLKFQIGGFWGEQILLCLLHGSSMLLFASKGQGKRNYWLSEWSQFFGCMCWEMIRLTLFQSIFRKHLCIRLCCDFWGQRNKIHVIMELRSLIRY